MAITASLKTAAGYLNDSLEKLGFGDYRIDLDDTRAENPATDATVDADIKKIGALTPSILNPIMEQFNIILVFRNYAMMFDSSKNMTRKFWRDAITNGGGEEDIFHEIIEPLGGYWAEDFDGTDDDTVALNVAKDLVKFHKADVVKKFHTKHSHFTIPCSISDLNISKVFTAQGLTRYVDVKMANIQYSAEVKLMEETIANIVSMANDGNMIFVGDESINNKPGVDTLVEDINAYSDGMQLPSTAFNKQGVKNMSDASDLFLVTTPANWNRIKNRGYSNAFNLSEYKTKNQLIMLPAGTDLGDSPAGEKVLAMLIDRRAIVMAMRYWKMLDFRVSNTDYINFFLKVEYIMGYNEFFNAVAFCGDAIDDFDDYQPVKVVGDVDLVNE